MTVCSSQGVPNCFAGRNYDYWGAPVEIVGLALAAMGITLVIVVALSKSESKQPTFPKKGVLLALLTVIIGFVVAVEVWYASGGVSGGASGSVAIVRAGLIFLVSVIIARVILGLPLRPGWR